MKKSLFIMALGAFALTSCSQDEVLDVQKDAVQFSVVADKASRGNIYESDLVDLKKDAANKGGFNVTAFNSIGGTFMEGVDVEWNGTIWNYGNTKFWPTTEAIDFYSYAPIALENAATIDFNKNSRTITYEVPTTCADQIDILYAVNNDLTKETGNVSVNFRHALSQVVFQAKNVKSDLNIEVTNVRIVNVKNSGTFTLPTADTAPYLDETEDTDAAGVDAASRGTWADITATAYKSYSAALKDAVISIPTTGAVEVLSNVECPLLVMPQGIVTPVGVDTDTDGKVDYLPINEGKTYFAVKCRITQSEDGAETLLWPSQDVLVDQNGVIQTKGYAEVFIPATVPTANAWKQGYKYVYTFVFGEGAGFIGPNGSLPETGDPTDNEQDDVTPPTDVDDPGMPVLVPVTFTVTVDQFQDVQEVVDMNTDNAVNGTTPNP